MSYVEFTDECELVDKQESKQESMQLPESLTPTELLNLMYFYEDTIGETTDPGKLFVYKLKLYSYESFIKFIPHKEFIFRALQRSAADWIHFYHGYAAIVGTDRIILIGKSSFRGKVKKLETLISGYCSVRFNHWFKFREIPTRLVDTAHMDCRLMQPADSDVITVLQALILEYIKQNPDSAYCCIYKNQICSLEKLIEEILEIKRTKSENTKT